MKTPEQIRAWLKAREWWPQFVKNTVAFDYRTAEVLSGDRGEDTVLDAFCWEFTSEGFHYWYRRNTQFLRWYLSNEPTIPKEEEVVISIGMFAGGMAFTTMIHHIAGGNWALAAANAACFVWLLFFSIKTINGR